MAGISRFLSAPSRCSGLVEMTRFLPFSTGVLCFGFGNDRLRFRGAGRTRASVPAYGAVALLRLGRNDKALAAFDGGAVLWGSESTGSAFAAPDGRGRPSLHTAREGVRSNCQ